MAVNLAISGAVSPSAVEQGRPVTLTMNYGNSGDDTGFAAQAVAIVPPGFLVVSPNPTVLGDIGPARTGSCSFTLNVSDELAEGEYGLTVAITCEERHLLGRKQYRFPLVLRIRVLESMKKRAAKSAISEAEGVTTELRDAITRLDRAGGVVESLKAEEARQSSNLQSIRGFLATDLFDKVLTDSDRIKTDSSQLAARAKTELEALRKTASDALDAAEKAKAKAFWARPDTLTGFSQVLSTARTLYGEGKYSEATKTGKASIGLLPPRSVSSYPIGLWNWMAGRRRHVGLLLVVLGIVATGFLFLLGINGTVSLVSVVLSISVAIIGLGLSLRRE